MPTTEPRAPRRAVIVTGVAPTYAAVRRNISEPQEHVAPRGTIYELGNFEGWEVAIAQVGHQGSTISLGIAEVVDTLRPEVVLFVGHAFALARALKVGDVVVATDVVALPGNRWVLARGLPVQPTHRLVQRARFEAMSERWTIRRRADGAPPMAPSTIHIGTIATAPSSIKDDEVRAASSRALALDLESLEALGALGTSSVDVLVLRTVVGRLDAQPATPDEAANAFLNVAAFAFELLARLPPPTRHAARTPAVHPPPAIAYLTALKITQIRALTECTWDITPAEGPGWHVMLGDNGAGKSTLLRSIALALFDTRETEGLRLAWPSWLHVGADTGSIAVTLTHGTRATERSVVLRRGSSDSPNAVAPAESTHRNEPASVFSAGYGPFRRFSGGDIDYEKELDVYPRLVRHMSLFSERVALTESLAWLKDLRFKQLENDPDGELLTDLRAFLNNSGLLPNDVRLAEVSSDAVTFVDANGATVPIEELSDGFRSVLSLTLDLLRHMAAAYGVGNLFSPVDPYRVVAAGIVLIDEVDVHLHPSWQHRIAEWFTTRFPAVQFIVATHSPILCQGATTVFLLPQPGSGTHGRRLAGTELERVRHGNVLDAYGTGVFGQGVTRSEESKLMLGRLAELNDKELEAPLTPEEQAEQDKLRAVLPTRATVSSSS